MEANDDLYAWTGVRNAPVAVLDDEPPQITWLEILLLAERLGSGPPLLPSDPLERALVLGFSTEICGADGFGWSRRLELMGRNSTRNPPSSGSFDMARMTRSYGVRPETIARAPSRMISIMNGLATQLHRQKAAGSDYLVGKQLTACDLHWACFAGFVSPLPPADCPMPDFMRDNYTPFDARTRSGARSRAPPPPRSHLPAAYRPPHGFLIIDLFNAFMILSGLYNDELADCATGDVCKTLRRSVHSHLLFAALPRWR